MKNHAPYVLRGPDGPEWYCIVAGRVHGPWLDKGSCMAGYKTEKSRHEARRKG